MDMSAEYPAPLTPLGQQAEIIYQQGYEVYQQQHFDLAQPLMEQSLAMYREAQHMPGVLRALHVLGNIAFEQGQYSTARTFHEEVLENCRASHIMVGVASSLNNLGLVAERQAKYSESIAFLEESIRIYVEIGDESSAIAARSNLASVFRQQGIKQRGDREA
jgi:tetratricopeptide (TPR) repeat protein